MLTKEPVSWNIVTLFIFSSHKWMSTKLLFCARKEVLRKRLLLIRGLLKDSKRNCKSERRICSVFFCKLLLVWEWKYPNYLNSVYKCGGEFKNIRVGIFLRKFYMKRFLVQIRKSITYYFCNEVLTELKY